MRLGSTAQAAPLDPDTCSSQPTGIWTPLATSLLSADSRTLVIGLPDRGRERRARVATRPAVLCSTIDAAGAVPGRQGLHDWIGRRADLQPAIYRRAAEARPIKQKAWLLWSYYRGGSVHPNRVMTGSAERRDDASHTGAYPKGNELLMSDHDTLLVLAASYDDLAKAEADYEAVKAIYHEVETSHDFDAAVVARDENGKVEVVKKHEQPTRHGAAHGLGWGLAVGAACALLPAVGLLGGLAVGGGAGAAIGAVTGHMKGGMDNDDLKQLGDVLEKGQAGLIVVYATNMADQIAANVKAVNKHVSKEIDANADGLARQLHEAEAGN